MHLFAVLGEPIRFRIVELLASGSHRAGELSSVLVSEFGISRSAVSHHLRILRDEGVVAVQTDETVRLYRLRWNVLDRVDRVLLDLYEKWDQREGWPYVADPLHIPPRRHRLTERARRPVETWKLQVEPLAPDDVWDEEDEEDEEEDEHAGEDDVSETQ